MIKHKYNLKKDKEVQPEQRFTFKAGKPLPAKVQLDFSEVPVYDQGELGACSGCSICGAYNYCELKQYNNKFTGSRLFVYYNERSMEETIKDDSGAVISDGISSLGKWGVCSETTWPYDISKFTDCPSKKAYGEAFHHRAVRCLKLTINPYQLKSCLASGFPYVVGISVYESFEGDQVAKTGIVPMPNTSTEKLLGGHAVLCIGYDDKKKLLKFRNSWGTGWGDQGNFYLPYDYGFSTELSSDAWKIERINDDVSFLSKD